jgi:hypothetical protein
MEGEHVSSQPGPETRNNRNMTNMNVHENVLIDGDFDWMIA